ncbi:MAG TPA: MFS transporter, partial [Gemmataceae bacterium]|nr:MFS transporter [Gemmataceae bacterium]
MGLPANHISESANHSSPTSVRYLVVAALSVAAAICYIPRNYIGVAEKTIRTDLGLTPYQSGWVLSAFFITYALAQIPSGQIGHAWGTRRVLPVIAVLWSLMSGAAALASGFFVLFLTRLGMGAAQAGIFPCSTSSIAKWLPPRRWALANGLLGSSMQLGGAAALMLTGFLLERMDWRWVMVLYTVPGMVWAVWFYLWFRDRPEEHPGVNATELKVIQEGRQEQSGESASLPAEPTPWVSIFTSWAMICICTQQFLRAAGFMFYNSWFATFLQETRSVSVAEAGVLNSLPVWATVV